MKKKGKAFELYQRASDLGDVAATSKLAECYESGKEYQKTRKKPLNYIIVHVTWPIRGLIILGCFWTLEDAMKKESVWRFASQKQLNSIKLHLIMVPLMRNLLCRELPVKKK